MMIGVRCGSVILACSPESIHADALAQIRQAELLAEYLRATDGGLANRHDAPPAHTNARSAIAGQGDGGK